MSFRAGPSGLCQDSRYVETMRVGSVSVAVLLMLPAGASAQLCVGNTGFGLARIQPSANIDFDHHAQLYALEARFHYHRAFAAAELGLKTWEQTTWEGQSRALAVSVGLDPAGAKSRLGICPLVQWTRLSGPHRINGSPWNFSQDAFAASLNVGFLLARRQLWDFMPTMAVTVGTGNPQLTTVAGGSLSGYQDFCCGRQTFTSVRLGLGLGYSDDLALIPSITWPLDNGGLSQKTYAVRVVLRVI